MHTLWSLSETSWHLSGDQLLTTALEAPLLLTLIRLKLTSLYIENLLRKIISTLRPNNFQAVGGVYDRETMFSGNSCSHLLHLRQQTILPGV